MNYKPFCNTEILFLSKAELKTRLLEINGNTALVMSKSGAKRWMLDGLVLDLEAHFNKQSTSFVWINSFHPNPTQEDIADALGLLGIQRLDTVIAIGGGSAIDLGKGISAFAANPEKRILGANEILEQIKSRAYAANKMANIIAVPTTAGTGSEVTQWATLWDQDKTAKFSLDAPKLQPRLALIVPELTVSMPPQITLSTGLDALAQAIEAYWSKHTTPIVQEIAFSAIEIIVGNLRKALDRADDMKARENLSKASVLSGMAFAKTRTTACHSISYPLTMLFAIPHGLAVALTLGPVGEINKGNFPNHERIYAFFQKHGGLTGWINNISEGVVRMRLSSFGITSADIPKIVENAFTAGRMDNNPVDLSPQDVIEILLGVL